MIYWNTPPSSISNLVLYPRSALDRKIIFLLGSIRFNWESIDSRFLHIITFLIPFMPWCPPLHCYYYYLYPIFNCIHPLHILLLSDHVLLYPINIRTSCLALSMLHPPLHVLYSPRSFLLLIIVPISFIRWFYHTMTHIKVNNKIFSGDTW